MEGGRRKRKSGEKFFPALRLATLRRHRQATEVTAGAFECHQFQEKLTIFFFFFFFLNPANSLDLMSGNQRVIKTNVFFAGVFSAGRADPPPTPLLTPSLARQQRYRGPLFAQLE